MISFVTFLSRDSCPVFELGNSKRIYIRTTEIKQEFYTKQVSVKSTKHNINCLKCVQTSQNGFRRLQLFGCLFHTTLHGSPFFPKVCSSSAFPHKAAEPWRCWQEESSPPTVLPLTSEHCCSSSTQTMAVVVTDKVKCCCVHHNFLLHNVTNDTFRSPFE